MITGRRLIDSLRSYTPQWLVKRPKLLAGWNFLWVIALCCDIGVQATLEGVRAAFPGYDNRVDNLPLLGASRGLIQGETETPAAFIKRLQAWLTTYNECGDEVELATQLRTWLGNNPNVTIITRQASVTTTVTAGSNGAALPVATLHLADVSELPFTGVVMVQAAALATTVAAGSNGANLPVATLNVASTANFPTTGTVQVAAGAFAGTSIAAGSAGAALPQATIHVASTTGFPTAGTVLISVAGYPAQAVAYTGVSGGNALTGCSGGADTLALGAAVYCGGPQQEVAYTGIAGNSFTGCSGGTGQLATGGTVGAGGGVQAVAYTGTGGGVLTGCTGGVGTLATGNAVSQPYARYTQLTGAGSTRVVAPFNWDAVSHPERAGYYWDFWIVIQPTEFGQNNPPGGAPPYSAWEGPSQNLGWGHECTRLQLDTVRGLVGWWKGEHMNCRAIVWSYDATLFDPAHPYLPGDPDGTWGLWYKRYDNTPSRNLISCRFWTLGLETS